MNRHVGMPHFLGGGGGGARESRTVEFLSFPSFAKPSFVRSRLGAGLGAGAGAGGFLLLPFMLFPCDADKTAEPIPCSVAIVPTSSACRLPNWQHLRMYGTASWTESSAHKKAP